MTKQQEYLDLKSKHEKELERFPIAYAFNDKQLEEALEKLGATKDECVSVFGHGDIVKRENAKPLIKMLLRQSPDHLLIFVATLLLDAQAFCYEMDNHEYAINWSADEDVLACFNITFEQINKWGLQMAYRRAREKHMKNAEEWGMI